MPEQPAPPAINHRDPNVLVWVAAQKIGLETLHNDPAWGRDIPNNATNGIGQNEVVREMLNRVLDAIASLAVSKPKLQVVAVALNIGNRWNGENPKLTMAENKELLPGLAEHITGVWDLLRQMTLQDADIEVLSARLTKLVDIYSVEKNLKRYNKWMPRLDLFGSVLSDAKVEGQDAFQKDLASLRVMHTFLQELAVDRAAHATLPAACKGINDIIGVPVARMAQWVTLVEQTKLEHCNPHFEDIKTWDPTKPDDWLRHFDHSGKGEPKNLKEAKQFVGDFQEWAVQVRKSGGPPSISRALKALTSQHRHIKALIEAAALPALRPLFVFPMAVEPVPPIPDIPVNVPATPLLLTANRSPLAYIIRAMYESIKPRITTRMIEKEVLILGNSLRKNDEANRGRKNTGSNNGVVHCECGLVAFLHGKSPYELATQFNYIGVSKLSCGPCHGWIMAYNETSGQQLKYHTGGTHGKWYPQWAIPPSLATTELKERLSKIICEQFVRYCDPNPHRMSLEDKTGSTNPIH